MEWSGGLHQDMDLRTLDQNQLMRFLEKLQEIDPAMPLSVIQTFIWVAVNDGKHQYDLERYLDTTTATASRCINWWSDWKSFRDKKKGPGYIESYPDPADKRYRIVRLTKKGREFWNSLIGEVDDKKARQQLPS